ncbi:hypothetical protein ENKNEFLB_02311 [Nocardioides aquaticus]|uniref:Uncharacterized protein n=1 Tax=Nocardioides aquaticus TaxID=160826 RepID=A0ABX8EJY0_9ACTN|nr:hypothetical protein [Nocardioides aquaticus]QVT79921.1 hypothetical protein ENKNEFLB_02311 [Nocardioides aquaticus]
MDGGDHDHLEPWTTETGDYYDRLVSLVQDSPAYAGAELVDGEQELVIFTVGTPSNRIAALIRAAPSSLRVTWRDAPYTSAELTDEVLRLMRERPARVSGGHALHDGTGIRLMGTDAELLAAEDPRELLGAMYPVTIERGGPAAFL